MDVKNFDIDPESLANEIWRIRSLVDTCVHLFPESPSTFEYEDELLAVLGIAQKLLHTLEGRMSVKSKPSKDAPPDPPEHDTDLQQHQ